MICRLVLITSSILIIQTVVCEKVKLDTLLVANMDQLLRNNPDYNLMAEHPYQIVPLEVLIRSRESHEKSRARANRLCTHCKFDFMSKPETIYELVFPEETNEKSSKGKDRFEGILPFMPPVGGFFG
ncbi:hypothetical protein M3Y97_00466700 [Aphelenchoides bicaudatus]|nr:hypothetical protein M3Y97_00466700 [Aphelenchoides bicaudatus]